MLRPSANTVSLSCLRISLAVFPRPRACEGMRKSIESSRGLFAWSGHRCFVDDFVLPPRTGIGSKLRRTHVSVVLAWAEFVFFAPAVTFNVAEGGLVALSIDVRTQQQTLASSEGIVMLFAQRP